ncbi:hypothetical protein [Lysobacter solisilvae (ex Woo and Kim 2020)]|uniref:DUF2306 domain-containing protein n=1 Tax=Agrilutibacter terrestris TaxID=2865112 RepID=A0A7H0FTM0_9GAMM|nr:hypothetical protein [Lysobacter terrestris]QNP39386.1 hypothetical protein H8B22_07440 [Lysobacter terrestris]
MTAYQMLVACHVGIGVIALASFWSAAFLRKGSPLHRRAGQLFLLAMCGILATGLPMAAYAWLVRERPVGAAFLAYLLVITAAGMWSAWRAIRDKHDVARYTGPVYVALAWLSLLSGLGVLVLGLRVGSPLLTGFSAVGLFAGGDMLRKRMQRERLAARPRWWLVEHYTAMLGNGIATHIAFLGIGLPRLLPGVDGTALHYTAWFAPLAVAIAAKLLLDRRWKPRVRPRAAAALGQAG